MLFFDSTLSLFILVQVMTMMTLEKPITHMSRIFGSSLPPKPDITAEEVNIDNNPSREEFKTVQSKSELS